MASYFLHTNSVLRAEQSSFSLYHINRNSSWCNEWFFAWQENIKIGMANKISVCHRYKLTFFILYDVFFGFVLTVNQIFHWRTKGILNTVLCQFRNTELFHTLVLNVTIDLSPDDMPELQEVEEDQRSPRLFQVGAGVSHQELSCSPSTNWLAELANIATSPQSPLLKNAPRERFVAKQTRMKNSYLNICMYVTLKKVTETKKTPGPLGFFSTKQDCPVSHTT